MPVDPARTVQEWLAHADNSDGAWLFRDVLHRRMAKPDWLDNSVMQVIARNQGTALSRVVSMVRQVVADEGGLVAKKDQDLNPEAPDFDDRISDFIAELVGVIYLNKNGFSNFRFLPAGDKPTPDLRMRKGEDEYFAEVKNLRAPNSPTTVAFSRWHRRRIEEPDRFNFEVLIDFLSQIEPDVDKEQANALRQFVDSLPEKQRPCEFELQLPKNMKLRISIKDGPPVMASHGTGGALDPLRDTRTQTFLYKVLDVTSKGLRQLYAPHLDRGLSRLLLLRWNVPDDAWLVAGEIRDGIRDSLNTMLAAHFPRLEVHILNNTDDLD